MFNPDRDIFHLLCKDILMTDADISLEISRIFVNFLQLPAYLQQMCNYTENVG